MKINYCVALCIMFALIGCKNETIVEKTVEIEKEHSWKPVKEFSYYDRMQLNSHADSNILYSMNLSDFIKSGFIDSTQTKLFVEPYYLGITPSIYQKYPICNSYFAVASHNALRISVSKDPMGYYATAWIFLNQVDNRFLEFIFPSSIRSEAIAINGSNSTLICYRRNDTSYSRIVTMIINFSIADYYGYNKLDTVSTQIIDLNDIVEPLGMYHYFGHYFVGAHKTHRISSTGEHSVCYEQGIYNMFSISNELYGMSWGKMLQSKDKGISWQQIGSISSPFEIMTYKVIDNNIIAHYNSQIFQISLNDSTNSIRELQNDGLEGNKITSITKFKDKFYVTTLSGVFSRYSKDFYTEKVTALKKQSFLE
jgi:hypothetical protein